MKHYPHHIGDFDRATRHLTRLERSVYRDLIDLYYDTEKPLSLDKPSLCRKILARSNEESTAVEQVLNEFFTETPTGWFHERCDEEILAYRANTSHKAEAGKASAAAKALRKQQALNGGRTPVPTPVLTDAQQPLDSVATVGNTDPTNHEPSTNQPVCGQATPHTQIPADFLNILKTKRPELEPVGLFKRFLENYPKSKQTVSKWEKWIELEIVPKEVGAEASVDDPNSKASIETLGESLGLGKYSGMEQWSQYVARVKEKSEGVPA
jgi:uncharacterized protein YdaU (DUF1376 family)